MSVVRRTRNCLASERKHYRLSDLEEITHLTRTSKLPAEIILFNVEVIRIKLSDLVQSKTTS